LAKFTLFSNLPVELQDNILKYVAIQQPRIVHIRPGGQPTTNQPVAFTQINGKTRQNVSAIYGYIEFQYRNQKFLFYPDIDLLYFGLFCESFGVMLWDILRLLAKTTGIDKIQRIVLDFSLVIAGKAYWKFLREFKDLDMLLIVMDNFGSIRDSVRPVTAFDTSATVPIQIRNLRNS